MSNVVKVSGYHCKRCNLFLSEKEARDWECPSNCFNDWEFKVVEMVRSVENSEEK